MSSTPGLVGAVQRLMVNGHAVASLGALAAHLPRYRGPPCEPADPDNVTEESACAHGGLCLPLLNTHACRCAPGFSGARCHQRECSPLPCDRVDFHVNSTELRALFLDSGDAAINGTLSLTARAVKFSGDTFLHFRGPKPQHPRYVPLNLDKPRTY